MDEKGQMYANRLYDMMDEGHRQRQMFSQMGSPAPQARGLPNGRPRRDPGMRGAQGRGSHWVNPNGRNVFDHSDGKQPADSAEAAGPESGGQEPMSRGRSARGAERPSSSRGGPHMDPRAGGMDPRAMGMNPRAGSMDPCGMDRRVGGMDPRTGGMGVMDPRAAGMDPLFGGIDPCSGRGGGVGGAGGDWDVIHAWDHMEHDPMSGAPRGFSGMARGSMGPFGGGDGGPGPIDWSDAHGMDWQMEPGPYGGPQIMARPWDWPGNGW